MLKPGSKILEGDLIVFYKNPDHGQNCKQLLQFIRNSGEFRRLKQCCIHDIGAKDEIRKFTGKFGIFSRNGKHLIFKLLSVGT